MNKEPILAECPEIKLSNTNSSTSFMSVEKQKRRISKIPRLKGKEMLEKFILKHTKNLRNSELIAKQANEIKKISNSTQSEKEELEPEENPKSNCLCCDKALALKRAKYIRSPIYDKIINSADFNKNLVSEGNCDAENFELTSKNKEDSYDAFFADYLGVSQNAVNHFVEKFNVDNFSNYIKDSLIPTIDTVAVQRREKVERERQARELVRIKIKSEESKNSYKEKKENKENSTGMEQEDEYVLIFDNYILVDMIDSSKDLGKFNADCADKFSDDDSSIIKTYDIIDDLDIEKN